MTQTPTPKATTTRTLKVNEQKWTKPMMEAGFTVLPSVIIERQRALGLDALDVNILLHLAMYWWTPDNKPHPSVGTIAAALNVTERTVQRRITALQELGMIRREERRIGRTGSLTNLYHFDGLIAAATPYAEERITEIEAKRAAQEARVKRRGPPKLTVVSTDT